MKKRILSFVLLAAMLLSLVACGGDSTDDPGKDGPGDGLTDDLPAGIEQKDYNEAQINVFSPKWGMYVDRLFSEENEGEALSTALYNRELKIEEYLGVEITQEFANGTSKVYLPMIQNMYSGDNLYQIVLTHCIYDTTSLIGDGMVYDLNEIETLNLDADWWNHKSNENLQIAGKQFYAINDFMIPDPNAVLFNKTMIEENNLENPYDLVKNKKWTIDKMMEMSSAITRDNGDNVWDVNDIYGFGAPSNWMLTSFTYGFGLTIVEKDADGYLQFAMDTPKAYDVAEKLDKLFSSPDTYVYSFVHDTPSNPSFDATQALNMTSGRCLFNLVALNNLDYYRDTKVEFGLLPYPLYDEDQDDYVSLDWSGLMCVPTSVPEEDTAMVGEVIELLAYFADAEVLPAYYDVVLDYKLTRDPEDRQMLDVIFDTILYDAGMNYFGFHANTGKFWDLPDRIRADTWAGYSSHLATYKDGAEIEIEAFNDAVRDIIG